MIVKTDSHTREQISKVVQLRANIEGLKLGPGVVDRLATEGEKSSLRSVIVFSRRSRRLMGSPAFWQICTAIAHASVYFGPACGPQLDRNGGCG